MAKATKSKWVIGLTGTALSAFVIGQIGGNQQNSAPQASEIIITKNMSAAEKEVVRLDWSDFEINGTAVSGGAVQNDRQTRRS